ncbi:phosphate ABC transporter substrate-binding protein PstS [Nocardioides dongxiaopingii]|uniref:phosphate ABC transporter substrate-binding protein PstS n=1 Tax=Nocardioides sp. S-1144 TaxID=2582905 RepID=UPI0011649478|nr:phosphate ABC transporter substrate-binding protein PstS [Nocardioides sp. S-1144]QCW50017.2 phosphate ABC transporter substrate-binding protein PstS [Nocardioides sp. S-1144]
MNAHLHRRRATALVLAAVALLAAAVPSVADDTRDPAPRAAAGAGPSAPAAPTSGRAAYATIEGTGSTWSKIMVDQWIADVDSSGIRVVYSGGGSTKGRRDFALNTNDFAISEIPFQGTDEDGNADTSNGREFAYLPIVAGGTAFTYQLKVGNEQVKNLRLSGETLAKIFTNQITTWNDPAIQADNNGRGFPAIPITPVVRSDGSGTTAQLTTWLDKAHPSLWRPYFGKSGLTSYYPRKGRMIGQSGSDQVMSTIKAATGNGTIGYVEYSYPREAGYPVVKVLNKAGYYVEPTEYNTAVALTKARINTTDKNNPSTYLTQILDGVYTNADPRAYPISSYSYMIIPTGAGDRRLDSTAKRQTLADFMYYSLCGGQAKAGDYGYSPLPLNLVQAGFEQLAKLKKADPAVVLDNRDVTTCANPTFDGTNPNKNVLAEKAPMPAACDQQGAGPCGTETGTGEPSTDDPAAPSTDGAGSGDGTGTGGGGGAPAPGAGPGGATPDAPGGGAPAQVDPETGAVVGTADAGGPTTVDEIYATSTLVDDRPTDARTFGWVAVVELLALVLVPGIVVSVLRRRRREGQVA